MHDLKLPGKDVPYAASLAQSIQDNVLIDGAFNSCLQARVSLSAATGSAGVLNVERDT